MRLLRNKWKRQFPELPFILHSHQFIEVNYVISSNGSSMISQDKTIPLESIVIK